MKNKKSGTKSDRKHSRKFTDAAHDFYRQDTTDPKTYAGRRRTRVRLGGLGDDGLPMTRNRLNTHRVLNFYYVWGFVTIGVGVVAGALSLFQGGTFDAWSMISSGGSTFHNIEIPLLLRLEGLYCIIVGVLFYGSSILGFSWLYDGNPLSTSQKWSLVNVVLSILWLVLSLAIVHLLEPISCLSLIALASFLWLSRKVEYERK